MACDVGWLVGARALARRVLPRRLPCNNSCCSRAGRRLQRRLGISFALLPVAVAAKFICIARKPSGSSRDHARSPKAQQRVQSSAEHTSTRMRPSSAAPRRPWLSLPSLLLALLLAAQPAAAACAPSSLGYACEVVAGAGVRVHWSLGGTPPANNCTAAAAATPEPSGSSRGAPAGIVHFALEAAAPPGWLALAFPSTPGEMWPADAVIGGLTDGSGAPAAVSSYHLRRYRVTGEDATTGWAQSPGYAATSGGSNGGTKLLCFSRALDSPNAAVVKNIDAAAPLAVNWALGRSGALAKHARAGSLTLGLADGTAASTDTYDAGVGADASFRAAHGALMLSAFLALIPAAVPAARHKWLAGARGGAQGKLPRSWFLAHTALNFTAAAAATAGIIVIFSRFGWRPADELAGVYGGHRALGLAVIAMLLVQVLVGAGLRPHLGHPRRLLWRRVHQAWGALTLLAGTVAVYLGISLHVELSDVPPSHWLGPALALSGLALLLALLLEAKKRQLQRSGRYDKLAHTVEPSSFIIGAVPPADKAAAPAAAPAGTV